MSALIRKRINLKCPVFTERHFITPNPTQTRPFATAAALLTQHFTKTNPNRSPKPHHALDGLVTRLLKQRHTKTALRLHLLMSTKNFGTDTSTFNPIIKWLTSKIFNDTETAWLVIRAMRGCNVEPDSTTYNYMVRAYLWEEKKTNVADGLFHMMKEKGMEPDGETNHELVLNALETQNVEFVVGMVKRKLRKGEDVLYVTHCVVLRVMVVCRELGKTVAYVRMVCEMDKAMGGRVFRFLARKLGSRGRSRDASVVVGEMVKRGLPVVGEKLLRDLVSIGGRRATC